MSSYFNILATSGLARAGILHTPHGDVPTPCFMPIATVGAVRHVLAQELRAVGSTMLLANTYHLMLRPGAAHVAARGGLHRFMGWNGPILTDSGGFQVFSLGPRAARRNGHGFVELDADGVRFRSHIDGSEHMLTPERAIDIQRDFGSDIAMVLDVCPPQPCTPNTLRHAVAMTTAWAERSIIHAERTSFRQRGALLYGIIQGGSDAALRQQSAEAITRMPFDGFAIGGVAVGESTADMRRAVEMTAPLLPMDRTRYLMGVGTPTDIVHAVQHGIDLFDCVLPTRDARHGRGYRKISNFKFQISNSDTDPWYETINIGNERWRDDDRPIDPGCPCLACRHHTLAYLRYLFAIGEPLGQRLLTLHNLTFYLNLMRELRCVLAAE
jgi:queuine tRNA-ribosyltransferase